MKKLYTILGLALFWLANAVYLTISAFNYQAWDTSKLFCDLSSTFSCSSLFAFDFAWIAWFPFPSIAMVVYPVLIWIALLGIFGKINKHFHILGTLAILGMMFNAYIIYHEFQVGIFCPACLACTLAITLIALLSMIWIYQSPKKSHL